MSEIDSFYTKSINALHSKDHLYGKPALQTLLEEAIKAKTGQERNLSSLVQTLMKQSGLEVIAKSSLEEAKAPSSSDHELELDLLLKEDLACVICQGMDVGARNRLLECTDCHSLYHQECHQPFVSQQEADSTWICASCKEGKWAKRSPTHSSTLASTSKPKSMSNSPRHSAERIATSSTSSSYKTSSFSSKSGLSSSSSKAMSSSSSSSSKTSTSKLGSSSSAKHSPVTTTSNIISADKRIQNMKKKAAKLHEKKKIAR